MICLLASFSLQISESFPQGNVLDVLLDRPKLRENFKSYILQAGIAVTYLHEQGIVHRDLKVENYLMELNNITVSVYILFIFTKVKGKCLSRFITYFPGIR